MIVLILILILAAASKFVLPPDDYYASVLLRAALHFFDPEIFKVEVVLLLLTTLAAYGAIFAAISKLSPDRAWLYALGIMLVTLAIYWLHFDHSVHASSRYYLRTALVLGIPIFAAMAALSTMVGEGIILHPIAGLQRSLISPPAQAIHLFAAIFAIVTLIQVVETRKFISAWTAYRAEVAALAIGDESDPSLGDPRFVSSGRISPSLGPLSWFSTTPYLSVILGNFLPNRLVIDPAGNYFWLSCATATENRDADRAISVQPRELVRIYSCLHR